MQAPQQNPSSKPSPFHPQKNKTSWRCPPFLRSLRFFLGMYIFFNAIIISAFILIINLTFYNESILDLGLLYKKAILFEILSTGEDYFNGIADVTYGFTYALKTLPDFKLPSEEPTFNASKWAEPFRTAIYSRISFEMLNLGTWFDDGSMRICAMSPLQHPEALARIAAAPNAFMVDYNDFCIVCSMSSTYNSSISNQSTVTEIAWYFSNGSVVPPQWVPTANLSTNVNQKPPWFEDSKAIAQFLPKYKSTVAWGGAIALKINAFTPAFHAFPLTFPLYNQSDDFVGMSGVATSLEVVNTFLIQAKQGGVFSPGTEAIILDRQLVVYASTLADRVPINTERTTAEVLRLTQEQQFRCQTAADSISTTATTGVFLCVKTVDEFGYAPASVFFNQWPLVSVPTDYQGDINVSKLFNDMKQGDSFVTSEAYRVGGKDSFVAAFGLVKNQGLNFHLGIGIFTNVDDFFTIMSQSTNVIIGVMAGAIALAWIITWGTVRHFLLPLEVVAQKMALTAHLRFDKLTTKKERKRLEAEADKNKNNSDTASTQSEADFSFTAEIYALQKAQKNMSNALNSFTKYLSREVVKDLQITGCHISLTKKYSVILQSDIAGFTNLSESIDTSLLSELLTEYFEQVCGIVQAHGSTIIMFIGDAIVAGWSIVFKSSGNDELKAAICALEMQRTVSIQPLAGLWEAKANRQLAQRVGVNAGEVFAGVTGSRARLAYSVSGPNYDFAGWLEAAGKKFGTQTTVSDTVADAIRDVCLVRYLMPVSTSAASSASPLRPGNSRSSTTQSPGFISSQNVEGSGDRIFGSGQNATNEGSFGSQNNAGGGISIAEHIQNAVPGSLASSSIASASGTLSSGITQHVYELVGLLPDLQSKLEDIIPPERAQTSQSGFITTSKNNTQSRLFSNASINNTTVSGAGSAPTSPSKARGGGNINNMFRSLNDDFVIEEELQSPTSPQSGVKYEDAGDFSGKAKRRRSSATSIDVPNNVERTSNATGTTADSNEKFIEKMSSTTRYLPAVKLVKRAYEHEKCTLVVTDLETAFSKEFSRAASFFANGDAQQCLTILEELKSDPKFSIFFRSLHDFKNEEEYEAEMHRAIGDLKRCQATFIKASKSAKLLYEQCKASQKDGQYVMRI